MINRNVFTSEVLYAILRRKKQVNKTYIIVSRLFERFDMSQYTTIVENRILDDEGISYAIDNDHVVMDILNNEIWLDEIMLHRFRDIMEGYIEAAEYNKYLDYVESIEAIRRNNDLLLSTYQGMSIIGLVETVVRHMKKYRKTNPEEVAILSCWCGLEVLSRTRIPKLYYFMKGLPESIKMKLTLRYLEKSLVSSLEERR